MADPIPTMDVITTKRQFLVEAIGMFLLDYIGGLAVMSADMGNNTLLGIAIETTFCLGFIVWGGAGISGGHFNGCATMCFFASRHIGFKKFLLYNLAQLIGSIIAGLMLLLYRSSYNGTVVFKSELGYPHADLEHWSTFTCFLLEVFGSFTMMFIAYITAVNHTRPRSDVFGFAIGGSVGMCIIAFGSISGAAVNPYRILGPAIVSGELFKKQYSYAWIYYIGDNLGGGLMGLFYYYVFVDWNGNESQPLPEVDQEVNTKMKMTSLCQFKANDKDMLENIDDEKKISNNTATNSNQMKVLLNAKTLVKETSGGILKKGRNSGFYHTVGNLPNGVTNETAEHHKQYGNSKNNLVIQSNIDIVDMQAAKNKKVVAQYMQYHDEYDKDGVKKGDMPGTSNLLTYKGNPYIDSGLIYSKNSDFKTRPVNYMISRHGSIKHVIIFW